MKTFAALLVLTASVVAQTPSPSPIATPQTQEQGIDLAWLADHMEECPKEVQLKIAVTFSVKKSGAADELVKAAPGVTVQVYGITVDRLLLKIGEASAAVIPSATDVEARWRETRKIRSRIARISPSAINTPTTSSTPARESYIPNSPGSSGGVWVNDYYRKDGIHVSGHWRSR